jgi:uncharacterized protein
MRMTDTARAVETKFVPSPTGEVDADGTFSGYASVFGHADLSGDVVERGAFARALRERGAGGIRMLFQHDPNQPIGHWSELKEDGHGLFVRGRLAEGVERAREVRALMRAGALDGLSIGFRTVRARRDAAKGVRRILEADLWEISVVTFPMHPGARIETIKSAPDGKERLERWLREEGHLTRTQARALTDHGFKGLAATTAVTETQALADRIRRAARSFSTKERT